MSVKGCSNNFRIEFKGEVITSEPIFAQLIIWIGDLMEAAKIWVFIL